MNIFKAIFLIALITTISTGIVYIFYQDDLDAASRPTKVVTSENYTSNIKDEIEYGDTVEITGTPDLLRQVSQEGELELENGEVVDGIQYYYVGLQEYGFDFVVRIAPGKLFAEEQTFTGEVTGLTQTDFGNRIRNSLNLPINFEDSVNEEVSRELDTESQEQLAGESEANFTSSTLLILDNETTNSDEVYTTMAFWVAVLSIFLITLLRKPIFDLE